MPALSRWLFWRAELLVTNDERTSSRNVGDGSSDTERFGDTFFIYFLLLCFYVLATGENTTHVALVQYPH